MWKCWSHSVWPKDMTKMASCHKIWRSFHIDLWMPNWTTRVLVNTHDQFSWVNCSNNKNDWWHWLQCSWHIKILVLSLQLKSLYNAELEVHDFNHSTMPQNGNRNTLPLIVTVIVTEIFEITGKTLLMTLQTALFHGRWLFQLPIYLSLLHVQKSKM